MLYVVMVKLEKVKTVKAGLVAAQLVSLHLPIQYVAGRVELVMHERCVRVAALHVP